MTHISMVMRWYYIAQARRFTVAKQYQSSYICFQFWVKQGFSFTQLNRGNTQNLEKIILTCPTKMIADQSSVTQYELSMCHMKEE